MPLQGTLLRSCQEYVSVGWYVLWLACLAGRPSSRRVKGSTGYTLQEDEWLLESREQLRTGGALR